MKFGNKKLDIALSYGTKCISISSNTQAWTLSMMDGQIEPPLATACYESVRHALKSKRLTKSEA